MERTWAYRNKGNEIGMGIKSLIYVNNIKLDKKNWKVCFIALIDFLYWSTLMGRLYNAPCIFILHLNLAPKFRSAARKVFVIVPKIAKYLIKRTMSPLNLGRIVRTISSSIFKSNRHGNQKSKFANIFNSLNSLNSILF